MIRSWFEQITFKTSDLLKKLNIFLYFDSFSLFFPILCPRENHSHRSSLSRSFLKSIGSDSLSSHFTKEWLWTNSLRGSLQKSDRELLTSIALYKRATRAIPSFAHKKWAICSKKRRANSQPCFQSAFCNQFTICLNNYWRIIINRSWASTPVNVERNGNLILYLSNVHVWCQAKNIYLTENRQQPPSS